MAVPRYGTATTIIKTARGSTQFIRPDEGGGVGGRCLPGATYNLSGPHTRVAAAAAAPRRSAPARPVDNVPLCVQPTHTHTHSLTATI